MPSPSWDVHRVGRYQASIKDAVSITRPLSIICPEITQRGKKDLDKLDPAECMRKVGPHAYIIRSSTGYSSRYFFSTQVKCRRLSLCVRLTSSPQHRMDRQTTFGMCTLGEGGRDREGRGPAALQTCQPTHIRTELGQRFPEKGTANGRIAPTATATTSLFPA